VRLTLGLADRSLLPSQFIVDGLGTRDVRLPHLLVKAFQIIEDQAAIDFHFDVASCAEAAVIRQTNLLADSNIEFEHVGTPVSVWIVFVSREGAEKRH
jgi:hypothetical protein